MRKVLNLIYENMAEHEVTLITYLLTTHANKEIIHIAESRNSVKTLSGATYTPDITIKEALEMDDVDGLIITGGKNDNHPDELTDLIKKMDNQEKILAAICRGPSFLARAGILEGRKYTTTYSEKLATELGVEDPFNRSNFQKTFVVRDNHIITAKGTAFVDFGMEILDYFGLFKNPEEKKEVSEIYKGNR